MKKPRLLIKYYIYKREMIYKIIKNNLISKKISVKQTREIYIFLLSKWRESKRYYQINVGLWLFINSH